MVVCDGLGRRVGGIDGRLARLAGSGEECVEADQGLSVLVDGEEAVGVEPRLSTVVRGETVARGVDVRLGERGTVSRGGGLSGAAHEGGDCGVERSRADLNVERLSVSGADVRVVEVEGDDPGVSRSHSGWSAAGLLVLVHSILSGVALNGRWMGCTNL